MVEGYIHKFEFKIVWLCSGFDEKPKCLADIVTKWRAFIEASSID